MTGESNTWLGTGGYRGDIKSLKQIKHTARPRRHIATHVYFSMEENQCAAHIGHRGKVNSLVSFRELS